MEGIGCSQDCGNCPFNRLALLHQGDAVDKFRVGMSFARFQLMHCGSLMQRTFDSRSDPRVKGFHPDAWQRKLLDVVDKRDSALVVAPTSSGKTLVSFYSMQCVLEQNRKENRFSRFVAYVCPTKALVNQVCSFAMLVTT